MFGGILLEQAQKAKTKVKSAEDKRKSQVQGREEGKGREKGTNESLVKKTCKKGELLRREGFRKNMNKIFHIEHNECINQSINQYAMFVVL